MRSHGLCLVLLCLTFSLLASGVRHGGVAPPRKMAATMQTPYWYESIKHNGRSPFIDNADSYKVYRNVLDFGADNTGNQDSSQAIQDAINGENITHLNG